MLSPELLRKVRLIEITTRKMVDDVMSGQYRSHFKGHGVQFSEHRQYVAGDDIRHIDWKVSARTREPLVKKYEEERELAVLLVVDGSGSGQFASSNKIKAEIAAEVAGMLAYAAIHTGDRVGLLVFSGGIDLLIPPKKGRQHTLRLIRDILTHRPGKPGTDLKGALEAAGRVMNRSGVVFVISDFIARDYDIPLKRLARRHDVVAITVNDERENEVPPMGQLVFVDPETGSERFVDTDSYAFKKWLREARDKRLAGTVAAFKSGKVENLQILTKDDYGESVARFFRARKRKHGR